MVSAMTVQSGISSGSLDGLRAAVSGVVFARQDAGLDDETLAYNRGVTHHPEVVVGVADEADVQAAVRFAVGAKLPARVQSTGHGALTPIGDGVLICTRRMNAINIDPATRRATIGAGVTWTDVLAAGAEHGLAPIIGSAPGVGAVGYSMGGGLGPLVRSHGATVDWVRGFRLVGCDGEVLSVGPDENPDLFWALRGGKGGFGVVTQMTVELAPLRTLYGGGLFFEGERNIERALHAWGEWTRSAPDSVTTSVAVLHMPDFEMVPPPLRGRTVLHLRVAYPGPAEEGARLIEPLRSSAPVYIDAVGEIPAMAMGSIHNDPEEGMPHWRYGAGLTSVDEELLEGLLEQLGSPATSPFMMAELRHLGGATLPTAARESAAGGLDAAFLLNLLALNPHTFEQAAPLAAAAVVTRARQWLSPVTNVNFAGDPADPEVFARLWDEPTHARLAGIRRTYDPAGVFSFGPPASPVVE